MACQRGDRSVGQVARDVDLTETPVREGVKQAERGAGNRDDGGLTTSERDELPALRRENRRLRKDVDILKRARAFASMPVTVDPFIVAGGFCVVRRTRSRHETELDTPDSRVANGT